MEEDDAARIHRRLTRNRRIAAALDSDDITIIFERRRRDPNDDIAFVWSGEKKKNIYIYN